MLFALTILACQDDEGISTQNNKYQFKVPENFPEPTYTFNNNPVSEAGFELGRKLFYDPLLSKDQTIACSSCHSQSVAFTDAQHRLSIGVDGRIGNRNAPSLANMAFRENFLWDGGIVHLDFVPVNAIENELEMDNDFSTIIERLEKDSDYLNRFQKAFGSELINSGRILQALSQFMVLMISADSDYDKYVRDEPVSIDSNALKGMAIFESKCATCHSGQLFTNQEFLNNGLDIEFPNDPGRALITEQQHDLGKFRVPGLRNVALTAPYMHDGRFDDLYEVLDHYSNSVKDSPGLSPILKAGDELGIPLTDQEKEDLIAFLNILTDQEFIADERFFGSR